MKTLITALILALWLPAATAQTPAPTPTFDADLAQAVGADEMGMRRYVLVVLKTGPTPVPAGPERDAMFQGHFANINRLAAEDKLAVAGPLDGVEGWRGLYIFFGSDVDAVRAHVSTDPVVQKGEMVAEYHQFYGSAALALVREVHDKIQRTQP